MQESKAILGTFINLILKITASKGGHHVVYEVTAFSHFRRASENRKRERIKPLFYFVRRTKAPIARNACDPRTPPKNSNIFFTGYKSKQTQTHTMTPLTSARFRHPQGGSTAIRGKHLRTRTKKEETKTKNTKKPTSI